MSICQNSENNLSLVQDLDTVRCDAGEVSAHNLSPDTSQAMGTWGEEEEKISLEIREAVFSELWVLEMHWWSLLLGGGWSIVLTTNKARVGV